MKKQRYLFGLIAATAGELSAATITYAPANGATAVPMNTEGLMVMAGLFLATGIWMLVKSKKGMGTALLLAGVLTGVYPTTGNAGMAAATAVVELTNPAGGTTTFTEQYNIEVTNISGVTVTITDIQPNEGAPTENQCTVGKILANGTSCYLSYSD